MYYIHSINLTNFYWMSSMKNFSRKSWQSSKNTNILLSWNVYSSWGNNKLYIFTYIFTQGLVWKIKRWSSISGVEMLQVEWHFKLKGQEKSFLRRWLLNRDLKDEREQMMWIAGGSGVCHSGDSISTWNSVFTGPH